LTSSGGKFGMPSRIIKDGEHGLSPPLYFASLASFP
jgi:hypothetical protein